jgi:hypothetical protein
VCPFSDYIIDCLVEVEGPGLQTRVSVRSIGGDDLGGFLR